MYINRILRDNRQIQIPRNPQIQGPVRVSCGTIQIRYTCFSDRLLLHNIVGVDVSATSSTSITHALLASVIVRILSYIKLIFMNSMFNKLKSNKIVKVKINVHLSTPTQLSACPWPTHLKTI